jgi:hypothetical protein
LRRSKTDEKERSEAMTSLFKEAELVTTKPVVDPPERKFPFWVEHQTWRQPKTQTGNFPDER